MFFLEEFKFSVQKLDINHSTRIFINRSFLFEDGRWGRLQAATSFRKRRIGVRMLDVVIYKWILNLIDSLQLPFIFSKVILLTHFPIYAQCFFYCGMMRITLESLFRYCLLLKLTKSFVGRPICPVDYVISLLTKAAEIVLGFKLLLKHQQFNRYNQVRNGKGLNSNKCLQQLRIKIQRMYKVKKDLNLIVGVKKISILLIISQLLLLIIDFTRYIAYRVTMTTMNEKSNFNLIILSQAIQMKPASKLSLKSKLLCMNEKHKDQQIKIVCLSPICEECPLLCSICLTEFSHQKCKYNLITVKQLQKKDLWKMDNWPTRPQHFQIKERLRKYDDLIELDQLIDRVSVDLKEKVNKAIDELKENAKSRYRLLIERREYDIEPLREIYYQAYNVDVVQKIVNDILAWRKNVYQGIEALQQFKKNEDRTLAIKELDIIITNGKYPDIPTDKVADRSFKVILWQLQNLPKQIFGEKKVTNTLEFLKETIEDDDGIYEGQTCNGKKHGQGKYYFKNGNIYEGEMYKGVMQGRGKYIWANQNVYEGTFLQDKMSGNGKLSFANGDVYQGEFINNRACGNGKMVAHNGEAYEGQFMNNLKQGKGKQYLKNGNIYEGEFYEGKWHGRGKILFPDATIDEGIWLQNSKQ